MPSNLKQDLIKQQTITQTLEAEKQRLADENADLLAQLDEITIELRKAESEALAFKRRIQAESETKSATIVIDPRAEEGLSIDLIGPWSKMDFHLLHTPFMRAIMMQREEERTPEALAARTAKAREAEQVDEPARGAEQNDTDEYEPVNFAG